MEAKITFLGTGQAIPTAKRNHTAMLLQYKNENILIDCGEGTQRQFRKAKLNPCKLTKILITHWHGDHVLGLPGLFQTLALNNYNKTLQIYGPKGTKRFISLLYKLFIHQEKIKLEVKEVKSGKLIETPDFYIEASQMKHKIPSLAYSFIEKTKLRIDKKKLKKLKLKSSPLLAKLKQGKDIKINKKKIKASQLTYKEPGKKITIILDTALNKNAIKLAKNSDLIISESTYSKDETSLAKEYQHLTSQQAAEIAKKSKSKKLILIHLSQRYENKEQIILKQAKDIFKNTQIAKDLDKIKI